MMQVSCVVTCRTPRAGGAYGTTQPRAFGVRRIISIRPPPTMSSTPMAISMPVSVLVPV